jgi:alpha-ketoglutarate-dependent taurine dioxygenase
MARAASIPHPARDVIDIGPPPTPVPDTPLGGRVRAWTRSEVEVQACLVHLGTPALDEVHALVARLRSDPIPTLLCEPEQFDMPRLRAAMAAAGERLRHGVGVAIVDRLPLDEMSVDEAHRVFWTLGRLIGRGVAQKWDGTMLYDVTDKGQTYGYGVRGSYTNVELVFHTDNAFGVAPPEYVGLMCLHPAREGGVSRFCSLAAVHDRMFVEHPGQLALLYRPMLWDRQAEHAPGAPRVARAPMFRFADGRLSVRANTSLVRKGHEVAGVVLDPELDEALTTFQAVTEDPALWLEAPIERGQLQYLDNVDIGHYRSEFRDHPDPARRRHLVRSWHRSEGRVSYDG